MLIMVAMLSLVLAGFLLSNHVAVLRGPRGAVFSVAFAAVYFTRFLFPVLAGAWSGNEYRWGTIGLILARRPDRIQQVSAGLIIMVVFTVFALSVALVMGSLAGLVAGAIVGPASTPARRPDIVLGVIETFASAEFVIMFYMLVAFAAGTIFQSPVAGVGLGVGLGLADALVAGIVGAHAGIATIVAQHLPYEYANALVPQVAATYIGRDAFGSDLPLSMAGSIAGVAVYSALLLGAMFYVVNRRDVTV